MKLHGHSTMISTSEYVSKLYNPTKTGREATICGSCPYDECVEERRKAPCKCDYFNQELKKFKGKKK